MLVRVPAHIAELAQANLREAQRIAATLSGTTTLQAAEAAEAALMRQPTKAELRLAIRQVAREARVQARASRAADPFAIPSIGAAA